MVTLDKDLAILIVLDRLWSLLGPDAFVLADYWQQDLCAIGIASPNDPGVLVYISSYEEAPGKFTYELELPPLPGEQTLYRMVGNGSGASTEELASIVAGHLGYT